jgi:hypothetical protein
MSLSVTGGVYSCACASGYTLTGVSAIGPQSCLLTTLTAAFTATATAAASVTYYDRQSGSTVATVASLTFQHYYLQAVSRCTYFGTAEDVLYCQQLANLCTLQLYDKTTQVW